MYIYAYTISQSLVWNPTKITFEINLFITFLAAFMNNNKFSCKGVTNAAELLHQLTTLTKKTIPEQ